MKNQIYIAVIGVLLMISFSLLLLYYTQEFNEKISFKNTINYADIEVKPTVSYNNEPTYVASARVDLGTIELENKGYFTQKYTYPSFVGCLNFKEESIQDSIAFNIEVDPQYSSSSYKEVYPMDSNQINIKTGEKTTKKLVATYNKNYNNQIRLGTFNADSISGIEIYGVPVKERNPFAENYRYYNPSYYYNKDCDQMKQDLELVKTISID